MSDDTSQTTLDDIVRMKGALERIVVACETWLQSEWKADPDGRIDAIRRQANLGLTGKAELDG